MEDGALGIDLSAVDSGKDLNFSLSGTIVPEPDCGLMGMSAVVLLLALRRRRGK